MSGGAAVVADIGGTKGRFAIADLESLRLSCVRSYSCAHFASPEAVFTGYRRDAGELPSLAAIAVAGPVAGGRVRMSNLDWEITLDDIGQWLGVKKVLLLNDFEAAAQALPVLGQEALVTLRHGEASGRRNLALLGPGTGLGVAGLVPASHGWQAVAGEGGHASFAVRSLDEWRLVEEIAAGRRHVSAEVLLSGGGLTRTCNVLAMRAQSALRAENAADVGLRALRASDPHALEAVRLFTSWLGRFAGDIALTYGALGGVFIAGGVVPRILPAFEAGRFLTAFADKGRMESLLSQIPVHVVSGDHAGLLGAAVAARALLR